MIILFNLFKYDFLILALVLGLAVGISAALISPFIVLNHQSNIADGLSHIGFTGIVFGSLLFNQPLYFAIPFAIVASFLIFWLSKLKMMESDSAIGIVSTFALAIGLIALNIFDGVDFKVEEVLVGQILTVTLTEVIVSIVLLAIVLVFILIMYRRLLLTTYDETFAKFKKSKVNLTRYLLSALTAVFVVMGVRTVGMLLISAFVVFPSLIASQLSKSFKNTLIISTIIAFAVIISGFLVSVLFDLPTGATIVVIYTITLLFAIGYRKVLRKN